MLNTPGHLLIVGNESDSLTKIQQYFQSAQYTVTTTFSDHDVPTLVNDGGFDLLLIDPYLSGSDNFELIKTLRKASQSMGIILISEHCDNLDRILGLEMGADDYIPKPFVNRELLARVKSLLRRIQRQESSYTDGSTIYVSGWKVDILKRQLSSPERGHVPLTRAEFELILALSKQPNVMMTREQLMKDITHRHWTPDSRVIDALVKRLRKKIEANPKEPELILTVYGEGYMLITETSLATNY